MDLCMGIKAGMPDLQDQGRGLINNSIDHNGYCAGPFYSASLGVKPENPFELPMDAIHLLRQNLAANDNTSCLGYSCLPWHQVVNHPAALVLCDPLWQRHLLMEQRREFESPPDSAKLQIKGEMPAELLTFEERQAALVAEVLGRGMSCNGNGSVEEQEQAPVHAQPPLEACREFLSAVGNGMNFQGKAIKMEPVEEAIGYSNSLQFDQYFGSSVCDSTPVRLSSSSLLLQKNRDDGRGVVSTSGSGRLFLADSEEGSGWQCAITNQILGYDSLPDLSIITGSQFAESSEYQQPVIAMPEHNIFSSVSPHTAPLNEFSPSESNYPAASWGNMSNTAESYASRCKEQSAKRPRISGCYTLEDILKKLPRGAALGLQTIRSNHNSPRNTSPTAATQFSLDLSSPSPGLSCSVASSSLEKDSDEKQLYRKPAYVSVEPQSIAARHRRTKIREKIRCLEKLTPLGGAKLDTARMLEVASKYVKYMQAQVHVLECMSMSPPLCDSKENFRSAGASNPSANGNDNMRSNAFDKGSFGGMTGSWNVNSLTNAFAMQRSCNLQDSKSKLKALSAQQMLHILVTSPTIQRKLLSEEMCVGTVEQYQMLATSRDSSSNPS